MLSEEMRAFSPPSIFYESRALYELCKDGKCILDIEVVGTKQNICLHKRDYFRKENITNMPE